MTVKAWSAVENINHPPPRLEPRESEGEGLHRTCPGGHRTHGRTKTGGWGGGQGLNSAQICFKVKSMLAHAENFQTRSEKWMNAAEMLRRGADVKEEDKTGVKWRKVQSVSGLKHRCAAGKVINLLETLLRLYGADRPLKA